MQDEIVSKTKRKQEMLELQALGVALVALPEAQLEDIALDENLRQAVLEAKRISAHEGRRRQMQYIGRLMRDVDPEPIRAKLDAITGGSAQANARHKRLEALRQRLLADDDALTEFAASTPIGRPSGPARPDPELQRRNRKKANPRAPTASSSGC